MVLLVFLCLKIAEISSFCLFLYLLWMLGPIVSKIMRGYYPDKGDNHDRLVCSMMAFMMLILAISLIGTILCLVYLLICGNWQWATEIVKNLGI